MKNQTLKTMLLMLIVIGSKTNISAQAWPTIGKGFGSAPFFSPAASGTYYSPTIAFSSKSNAFYTAFINANTYELVVMKSSALTGILGKVSWSQVGKISIQTNYTSPYIVINPITDEPYVACINNVKHEYVVQRFDISQNMWQQVGVITEQAIDNFLPVLSFKPNTEELYIAFISGANKGEVVVKKYDKNGWNSVGKNTIGNSKVNIPQTSSGYSIIPHRSCSFAFQPNTNEPYVAFVNDNNYLQVKKLSSVDENWYDFGILSSLGKAEAISWNALAFNPLNNMPYLAYSIADANYGAYRVKVAKCKAGKQQFGSTSPTFIWQDVLSDSIKLNNAASSIAFAPNTDNLYITGHDASFGVFLVKKFTGTTWSNLGYTYCSGTTNPLLSIGPSCGYNNARNTPGLVFNTISGKANLIYSNELTQKYELRYEP
jgi:hypothetical protein